MSAKFITGVLVVAATIAALSTLPAQAGDRDRDRTAKIIAGVAGAYIAGRIINDLIDEDGRRFSLKIHDHRPRYGGHRGGHGNWQHTGRKVLPSHCIRRVETRHHRRLSVMPLACLKRNHVSVHRMPQRCLVNWQGRYHKRTGYKVRCLHRRGFSFARYW